MAGNQNSGRRPMPPEVREARGLPPAGASPTVPRMTLPPAEGGPREPPEWLDDEAVEEWRRVVPTLEAARVLADVDYSALAQYCHEWGVSVRAARQLKREGLTKRTGHGGSKPNPLIKISKEARMTALRIATEFGLTPASRAKVKVATPAATAPATASPEAADDAADDDFLFSPPTLSIVPR